MWTALLRGLLMTLLLAEDGVPTKPTSKTPILQVGGLGSIRGQEMALSRSMRATAYLGIPYAPPPTGPNRFKEPGKPWPRWDGTRDATEYRPSCLQPPESASIGDRLGLAEKLKKKIEYHEDCLYLNVFVPDGKSNNGLWPVVVWLHPGDFISGTPAIWDGSTLAIKQKVIIVTASYRLNIFGFMATKDNKIPGNLGLLDQRAVLEWVQEHIRHFNGSKEEVTLWGHSAGAVSISLHLLSDQSVGKFQKAIIMSGNFLTPGVIKTPMSSEKIAEEIGCDKETMLRCLEKASSETLLSIAKEHDWGPTISKENNPNTFLTMEPEQLLAEDSEIIANGVPIMTGYTDLEDTPDTEINSEYEFKSLARDVISGDSNEDNETCSLGDILTDSILFHYLPPTPAGDKKIYFKKYAEMVTEQRYGSVAFKLGRQTSRKSETYVYRFDYKLKTSGFGETGKETGVPQQYELPFFWGMPYWLSLSPPITWNSQDKRLADVIMGFFGNFTKYSKPIENRRTMQWEPLDPDKLHIFIIDKNPNVSDSETFNFKSLTFWNDYYPKLKSQVRYCCSLHNTSSSRFSQELLLLFILVVFIVL